MSLISTPLKAIQIIEWAWLSLGLMWLLWTVTRSVTMVTGESMTTQNIALYQEIMMAAKTHYKCTYHLELLSYLHYRTSYLKLVSVQE